MHECSEACLPPIHLDMGYTRHPMSPKEYLSLFQEAFQKLNIVVVDIKEVTEFDPRFYQQVLRSQEVLTEYGEVGRSDFLPQSVFKIAFICYPPEG